jgi:3-methyladenine DNA glycosylase AlkD
VKKGEAMSTLEQIRDLLQQRMTPPKQGGIVFFKTGAGQYAEHDQFMGVKVPILRQIAKQFSKLDMLDIEGLLTSVYNEERLLALFILVDQYKKANADLKDELFQFYMNNLQHVNNWNLVDSSAHLILGIHVFDKRVTIDVLFQLAGSDVMWERRIAMVATWCFIRKDNLELTPKIARLLLKDTHDLIHKAAGWMLREMGELDEAPLIQFLDQHAPQMPRTMLRYSIEKLSEDQRKAYMSVK